MSGKEQPQIGATEYVTPVLNRRAFHCPHCQVYAPQYWVHLSHAGDRITHVQGYVWQLPERCVLVERQRRVNDWRSAQRDHGNSLGLGQRAARTSGHAAGRQNDEQNGDDLRARRREEHRHGAVGATISPMNQEVRRRSTPRAHPAVVSPRPDDAADRTSTCGPSCGPNRPLERVNIPPIARDPENRYGDSNTVRRPGAERDLALHRGFEPHGNRSGPHRAEGGLSRDCRAVTGARERRASGLRRANSGEASCRSLVVPWAA